MRNCASRFLDYEQKTILLPTQEPSHWEFAHTNVAAKDWKKIADFYINVFGCKTKPPQRNLSGEWLDKSNWSDKS